MHDLISQHQSNAGNMNHTGQMSNPLSETQSTTPMQTDPLLAQNVNQDTGNEHGSAQQGGTYQTVAAGDTNPLQSSFQFGNVFPGVPTYNPFEALSRM